MKLKRFELTLLLTLALLFTYAAAVAGEQEETASNLLRLHVIANSDSEHDQAVKLVVRDALLEECAPLLEGAENQTDVRERLRTALDTLAQTAGDTLQQCGETEQVTVRLSDEYYPTRYYDTFALPAGRYYGLKVTIGAGAGHNWWCVVFPPLCTQSAQAKEVGGLPEQTSIRFRTAEWVGTVRHWLTEKEKG